MKTWVEKLVKEYNTDKKKLEAYRDGLNPKELHDEIDLEVVDGMIGDMRFAVEWMRTGRRPGSRRGVENRNAYGRAALLDRNLFPSLDLEEPERIMTDDERRRIADILWKMSARERQCYLLHVSYGMSLADIAKELKLSKRSVQQYVDRAKKKIFL